MHATLGTGVAHRTMTVQDLNTPTDDAGPDGPRAADFHPRGSHRLDAGTAATARVTGEHGADRTEGEPKNVVLVVSAGLPDRIAADTSGRGQEERVPRLPEETDPAENSGRAVATTPASSGAGGLTGAGDRLAVGPGLSLLIGDPSAREATRQAALTAMAQEWARTERVPRQRLDPVTGLSARDRRLPCEEGTGWGGPAGDDVPGFWDAEYTLAGLLVVSVLASPPEILRRGGSDRLFAGLGPRKANGPDEAVR
jgi:hypothetical protein